MNHLERMKVRIYISVATAILASPGLALAGTVTVSYTGTVASVQGDGLGYTNGDAISGWFTYDDDLWVNCSSGTGVCRYNTGDVDSNTGDGGLSNSGALDYVY